MKKTFLYSLLLIIIPLTVYFHTLHSTFVWDDFKVVNDAQQILNPYSRSGIPWLKGFYRPIGVVSLQIDYLLWGKSPTGYHLSNILIHIFNVLLLFLLFKNITDINVAFFSSLLFSIHPVTTEVVSWVSCRFDLLALFFGLISLNCLVLYFKTGRKSLFFPVFVFALFSIFSKETGFMMALMLPLLWYFYRKDSIKSIQLFLLLTLILLALGILFLGSRIVHVQNSLFYTILYAFKIFSLYFYKLFYWKFITPYSVCLLDQIGLPSVIIGAFVFFLMISTIVFYIKKRHIIAFSLLWSLLLILPGLYASISIYYKLPGSDRFFYASLPGLAVVLVYLIYKMQKKIWIPILTVLLIIMAVFTYQKSSIWKNSYSLWKTASETCEYKWSYPIVNYAAASLEHKPEEAEELYTKLVDGINKGRLKSLYKAENDLYRLIGLVRLGYINEKKNNSKEADEYFIKALKGYLDITKKYPGMNKWELSSVNYHIGLHYYRKWLKTKDNNDLNLALSQATLAANARSTELLPNLLKTTILIKSRQCRKAYNSLLHLYKLFGKEKTVMNAIYQYDKFCKDKD